MKIALLGYGRMGQAIADVARQRGHDVVAIVCSKHEDADSSILDRELIQGADVCIDFTHPSSVVENIKVLTELGKDMVVGTTGWDDERELLRAEIDSAGVGCVYSSNFSLGVQLFMLLAERAAQLFDPFAEYDVAVHEVHHRYKADSPSGTGLDLAKTLLGGVSRKERLELHPPQEVPDPAALHVSSLRCGEVPGTHRVLFDSACDSIELTHTARNRSGFAEGAVIAAEWVQGRHGFFTAADMIRERVGVG